MNSFGDKEKEEIVKESLFTFIKNHIATPEFSAIDEIVLSYVVSILEELGEEPSGGVEDVFDAEGFCEMMTAYLPEFAQISLPKVCQWMFELEANLRQTNTQPSLAYEKDLSELLMPIAVSGNNGLMSETTNGHVLNAKLRKHHFSEASDGSYSSDSSADFIIHEDAEDYEQEIITLQEMFPELHAMEARHCLTIAGGDVGAATQLVIDRQESGQTLNMSLLQHGVQHKSVVNDDELKSRIIARYSFVDKDEDGREHRPVIPKSEPKKLVRYRDNKIVSLKGERFTEIKREDEEDNRRIPANARTLRQPKAH